MTNLLGHVISGPCGTGVHVDISPDSMDQTAVVSAWFFVCPLQSPAWDRYLLCCVHLRDVAGQAKPARKRFPEATHEILLVALNPEKHPTPEDSDTWQHLRPFNLVHQITVPTDENAAQLLEACAKEIVTGGLWAEPPLSGQTEPWASTLNTTARHFHGDHDHAE